METVKQTQRNQLPPGPGRTKGVPNKVTGDLKKMILEALDKKGGVKYLAKQADENPKAFLALLGRVLPMQVTGDGGGPVRIVFESSDANL